MEEGEKIIVSSQGSVVFGKKTFRCSLGSSGVSNNKQEGDGATPSGCFLIRKIYYRADRIKNLDTIIPTQTLSKDDGWCDDPKDPNYNTYVTLPYRARSESLWRDDNVYDIVAVLGYNDEPVIPGKGSAIFIHIARPDYSPTEGCVALSEPDLREILRGVSRSTTVCIAN